MPSIIPGYEYDIFISYRHNDNRSGWVTDFIDALQVELAATIKEPLSIYFDKNPHNGLLETHNVDKSLEGKLKCLIFIPIISQTYCDPKSFAWQHEFCVFNALAKEDQFGRDIKLGTGNVASRILPIKIHDLDWNDKSTIENEIGGALRAIEFIYKEAGVNRPLKETDSKTDNLNRSDYRNQVNKVANTIKELLNGLIHNDAIKSGTYINPKQEHSPQQIELESVSSSTAEKEQSGNKLSIVTVISIIAITAVITAGISWKYLAKDDKQVKVDPLHYSVLPPDGTDIELIGESTVGVGRRAIDISASGKRIVFIGNHKGRPHIFVRDFSSFDSKVLPQTEGAYACTLSPDANEVAYFVGNSLKKIRIDGGAPMALAEAANPIDILWDVDNTIYFSADEGDILYRYTQKVEELSREGVFNSLSRIPNTDYLLISGDGEIGLFDLKSRTIIELEVQGTNPKYVSPSSFLFVRGSTLMKAQFDLEQKKIISEPKEILTGIRTEVYGKAQFALSDEDTFIYIEGEDSRIGGFTWLDRSGKTETLPFSKENYGTFTLSPDETKIAAPIYNTTTDIWIFDLTANKKVRATNSKLNHNPVWQNNNSLFVGIERDIYLINIQQLANPILVLKDKIPTSISADGKILLTRGEGDLFTFDTQSKVITQITNTPQQQKFHASISPDGMMVAYTRNDSKAFHVYLQQATQNSRVVQVSTQEGSEEPRWTGDGKRIIYRSGQQWMEVEIINTETLEVGKPKLIAEGDYINIGGFSFDITKDGQKLLLVKGSEEKTASEIRVIKNGFKNSGL